MEEKPNLDVLKGTPYEKDYEIVEFLAKGSFGQVYRLFKPLDGLHYALKVFEKKVEGNRYETLFRKEAEILRAVRSPNVVKYIHFYEHSACIYILMEYCAGGDLNRFGKNWIDRNGVVFTEEQVAIITKGILKGLNHLHSKYSIVHRDIKPGNILVRNDGTRAITDDDFCIGDFGLSAVFNPLTTLKAKIKCGTDGYHSPEMLREEAYDTVEVTLT